MNFIAEKCECCDDIALGIECSVKDLQQTNKDTIVVTMTRDEMSKIFTQMDNYIGGRTI